MSQEAVQIIKESAPAGGAAILTLGSGYATIIQWMPIVFGSFATFTGGVLSIILTIKTWQDLSHKREERKYKKELRAEIANRRDHGLDCQRCIDIEILKELDGEVNEHH